MRETMEENNKTFIVKDEHIKHIIGVLKKLYTEEKESFDKRDITFENIEEILRVFSGKNVTLVMSCITAIANILPIENLEFLIEVLQSVLEARLEAELIGKIKEKMENSKS